MKFIDFVEIFNHFPYIKGFEGLCKTNGCRMKPKFTVLFLTVQQGC